MLSRRNRRRQGQRRQEATRRRHGGPQGPALTAEATAEEENCRGAVSSPFANRLPATCRAMALGLKASFWIPPRRHCTPTRGLPRRPASVALHQSSGRRGERVNANPFHLQARSEPPGTSHDTIAGCSNSALSRETSAHQVRAPRWCCGPVRRSACHLTLPTVFSAGNNTWGACLRRDRARFSLFRRLTAALACRCDLPHLVRAHW